MAKDLNYYKDLTSGGQRAVKLDQEEECAVLKAHDYGLAALDEDEQHLLHRVIGKLKDQIWP